MAFASSAMKKGANASLAAGTPHVSRSHLYSTGEQANVKSLLWMEASSRASMASVAFGRVSTASAMLPLASIVRCRTILSAWQSCMSKIRRALGRSDRST